MEEKQALVQVTPFYRIILMGMLMVMIMIHSSNDVVMMVVVQANLELKERMESALEREERARAELQDSKDQVGKNNFGW